ncbi:hypothetical protein FBULB1_3908 [Fusarium bulbicola]|nr:hypothetical protein FBULB1_3908 [Fusarium bulbicola]
MPTSFAANPTKRKVMRPVSTSPTPTTARKCQESCEDSGPQISPKDVEDNRDDGKDYDGGGPKTKHNDGLRSEMVGKPPRSSDFRRTSAPEILQSNQYMCITLKNPKVTVATMLINRPQRRKAVKHYGYESPWLFTHVNRVSSETEPEDVRTIYCTSNAELNRRAIERIGSLQGKQIVIDTQPSLSCTHAPEGKDLAIDWFLTGTIFKKIPNICIDEEDFAFAHCKYESSAVDPTEMWRLIFDSLTSQKAPNGTPSPVFCVSVPVLDKKFIANIPAGHRTTEMRLRIVKGGLCADESTRVKAWEASTSEQSSK